MSGRSMMVLVLAGLSGLAAMLGARQLLARGNSQESLVEVIAAARDLQVEEVLVPDMVKVVKMPRSAAPVGSFTSFKDISERWVRIPMLAGEPIVDAKLAAKDMPVGLLARIPPGMRAFALEVNEQSGVSYFVQPDHHVDVILARNRNTSHNAQKPESETVLQDVLVLAAGTATVRPEDKTVEVRTVALALTPAQVDTVVAARTEGTLSLALRGHNDHEQVAVQKPVPEPEPIEVLPAPVEEPPPTPIVPLQVAFAAQPEPQLAPASSRPWLVIWHGHDPTERETCSKDENGKVTISKGGSQ